MYIILCNFANHHGFKQTNILIIICDVSLFQQKLRCVALIKQQTNII